MRTALNLLPPSQPPLYRSRRGGTWQYFMHYTGWNKKYDEWVEGPGLVKCAQGGVDGAAAVSRSRGVINQRHPLMTRRWRSVSTPVR